MENNLDDNLRTSRKAAPSIGRRTFPMTIQDRTVQSNETGGIPMGSLRSLGECVSSFKFSNTISAGMFCPAEIFPRDFRKRQIT